MTWIFQDPKGHHINYIQYIVEKDGSRVKIHYVGYNDDYDEWREVGDIVSLSPESGNFTNTANNLATIQSL